MRKSKFAFVLISIVSWGIVLGYLTAIRTELSYFWLSILEDGILAILSLVLLISFLAKTNQMKNLLGVFGGALSIGHKMIPSIRLFLTLGDKEPEFLISAVFDLIFMALVFYFFGSFVLFCLKEAKLTLLLYSLFAGYGIFVVISGGFHVVSVIDLLIVVLIFILGFHVSKRSILM